MVSNFGLVDLHPEDYFARDLSKNRQPVRRKAASGRRVYFDRRWVVDDVEVGVWAGLTDAAKKLWLPLLLHRNGKTGVCFASLETLAEYAGLSERGSRNGLKVLKEKGLLIDAGYEPVALHRNVKRRVLRGSNPRYNFEIDGGIVENYLWAKMEFHEAALYVPIRVKEWNLQVKQLWSDNYARYRAKYFYPKLADLDPREALGHNGELNKPFLHITTRQKKNLGELAGFYPHDRWRRNQCFEGALRGLDEKGLVKIVTTRSNERLIFPLPRAGIWGT